MVFRRRLSVGRFWFLATWRLGKRHSWSHFFLASLDREGCGFLMAVGSSARKKLYGVLMFIFSKHPRAMGRRKDSWSCHGLACV